MLFCEVVFLLECAPVWNNCLIKLQSIFISRGNDWVIKFAFSVIYWRHGLRLDNLNLVVLQSVSLIGHHHGSKRLPYSQRSCLRCFLWHWGKRCTHILFSTHSSKIQTCQCLWLLGSNRHRGYAPQLGCVVAVNVSIFGLLALSHRCLLQLLFVHFLVFFEEFWVKLHDARIKVTWSFGHVRCPLWDFIHRIYPIDVLIY